MRLPKFTILTLIITIGALFAACSTYKTLDPRRDKLTSNGQSRQVDETDGQYGQPYYLPKGLIHLVIKQEANSTPKSATPSTASTGNNNSQVVTVNTATANPNSTPTDTTDSGTLPYAYTITVERVIVPDLTTGPYLARYEQNWLYAENISISVTDDGLLSTVSTTASDRTAQILSNLEDTAINVAKFTALAALTNQPEEATPRPPQVRYKRLNIDVTFDPLDPKSVGDVQQLFNDETVTNSTEGNTYLISPFKFELTSPYWAAQPLRPKQPTNSGLLFRETTPVRLVFRQNSTDRFRAKARQAMKDIRDGLDSYREQKAEDQTKYDQATAKSLAAQKKLAADQKTLDDAIAQNKPTAQAQALVDQDTTDKAAVALTVTKCTAAATASDNALKARTTALKLLYDSAAAPTISRSATFIKAIPNPDRVFSFNLARSAFVQNKKTDLTISNGLLTKVSINKPSEAEGFSEIPLTLSKKLAELPKDLLTVRTQTTTPNTAKNSVNAQTTQAAADPAAELEKETAQLKAEADKLEAEAKVIQAQRALQGAANGQ